MIPQNVNGKTFDFLFNMSEIQGVCRGRNKPKGIYNLNMTWHGGGAGLVTELHFISSRWQTLSKKMNFKTRKNILPLQTT